MGAFFYFILGTIFGSFCLLVASRTIREESIVYPGSHCEFCGHDLGPRDLVPIISYLSTGGRCRYCKKRLSLEYPLIECLLGLIFLLVYKFYPPAQGIFLLASACLGLIISLTDIKTTYIYESFTILLLLLGLIYRFFYLDFGKSFLIKLLVFSLSFLALYFLSGKKVGLGDLDFYLVLALFLKDGSLLRFFLYSVRSGALYGLLLGFRRKTLKVEMPFCPFIFLAYLLVLFGG